MEYRGKFSMGYLPESRSAGFLGHALPCSPSSTRCNALCLVRLRSVRLGNLVVIAALRDQSGSYGSVDRSRNCLRHNRKLVHWSESYPMPAISEWIVGLRAATLGRL